MNYDEKDSIEISKNKFENIFGKNLLSISLFISLIIILISIFAMGGLNSIYSPGMKVILVCCCFLVLLAALARKRLKGFANSIDISFSNQRLTFKMFNNELVEAKFDQINRIRVNGYIFFELQGKTIKYNDLTNRLLFEIINKVKKIEWGDKCSIWGPPKEFRKKLEEDR